MERDRSTYLVTDTPIERLIKLDRHGTRVRMMGPYELDTLLDVAASLEPAPTASPPVED